MMVCDIFPDKFHVFNVGHHVHTAEQPMSGERMMQEARQLETCLTWSYNQIAHEGLKHELMDITVKVSPPLAAFLSGAKKPKTKEAANVIAKSTMILSRFRGCSINP